jgi:hypothetical protein
MPACSRPAVAAAAREQLDLHALTGRERKARQARVFDVNLEFDQVHGPVVGAIDVDGVVDPAEAVDGAGSGPGVGDAALVLEIDRMGADRRVRDAGLGLLAGLGRVGRVALGRVALGLGV